MTGSWLYPPIIIRVYQVADNWSFRLMTKPLMDACLPVIVGASGERCGIIAVFSGICLTVLTPLFCSGVGQYFILREIAV